jgi:hypothetical protein
MVKWPAAFARRSGGSALVPDYRVYTLGEDGHIKGRTEFRCPDDEAALEHAKQLADGHAVELWEYDRRIALVDGKDGSATPPAVRSANAAPNRSGRSIVREPVRELRQHRGR